MLNREQGVPPAAVFLVPGSSCFVLCALCFVTAFAGLWRTSGCLRIVGENTEGTGDREQVFRWGEEYREEGGRSGGSRNVGWIACNRSLIGKLGSRVSDGGSEAGSRKFGGSGLY